MLTRSAQPTADDLDQAISDALPLRIDVSLSKMIRELGPLNDIQPLRDKSNVIIGFTLVIDSQPNGRCLPTLDRGDFVIDADTVRQIIVGIRKTWVLSMIHDESRQA